MPITDDDLLAAMMDATPEELDLLVASLPSDALDMAIGLLGNRDEVTTPTTPAAQAVELDPGFIIRSHLAYLSDRIAQAVADVEAGEDRRLIVSMPPRHGKSHLGSTYAPLWLLRKHPDWKLMLLSHSPNLAASWGRQVRRIVEDKGKHLGISIAPDAKAVTEWETTQKGSVVSRSVGQALAGLGARVMIIDDPVRDAASAASEAFRDAQWTWWQMDASTRLEPPSLVIVIATRWHEDDLIGRLTSPEHSPDTHQDWEQIVIPAIANHRPEKGEVDVLDREPGEPLLSPIVKDDTPDKARKRFATIRSTVGAYGWAALYDQKPAPAAGAILSVDWWRFWSTNPAHVTEDGRVRLLDDDMLARGIVIESWDATFKETKDSDYVVGQRWGRVDANQYLLAQRRDRMSFTKTIAAMKAFGSEGIGGDRVIRRLIEDKANGPAILDTLRDELPGLKPINPRGSKEARARAVAPLVESGNVYLPDPRMPGFEWVRDFMSEARDFPTGSHDDQIDAFTQAADDLRTAGAVTMRVPAGSAGGRRRGRAQAGAGRMRW